ncbi:hypothetical protein PtB15_7B226 [Puccinia triticina]|nr:hypothetical protein PtB15_7B226 [Puccinia triticina]
MDMGSSSSKSLSSTPPPTQQDLEQNIVRKPLPAPSYREFILQNQSSPSLALLNPKESILPTEIQEITPKEYRRSIDAAARSASNILALKLPRHCKQKAQELAASLHSSKRSWEETGVIPEEEDIKITNPADHPHPTSNTVTQSRKRVTRRPATKKPATKHSLVRAVDLLTQPHKNPPVSPAPGPAAVPASAPGSLSTEPPTNNLSCGADGPLLPSKNLDGANKTNWNPWEPVDNRSSSAPDDDEEALPTNQILTDVPAHNSDGSQLTLNLTDSTPNANPTGAEHPPAHKSGSLPLFKPASPDPRPQDSPSAQQPSTTSHSNDTTKAQPANSSPGAHSVQLTIIQSTTIRTQVISISQSFSGSKPSWSKYQTTWTSLAALIQNRAPLMPPPPPPRSSSAFHLQRAACSYGMWLQTIASLAETFLSPSLTEQWYCPDVIDFPRLTGFGDKNNNLRPGSFIPTVMKTPHPESALVQGLF